MDSILIKNATLANGQVVDILVSDSKIVAIVDCIEESEQMKVIDAQGKFVFPGFIDAHTHYHLVSRGTVTADSFPQGSRCALFGGVTTVVDFADHDKKVSLWESSQERLDEMKDGMVVDYALHEGVYGMPSDVEKELKELKEKGVGAIKLFTTYKNVGYMIDNPDELDKLFETCKKYELMVTVHCEDDSLIQKINDNWEGTFLPKDHALLRPSEVEAQGIRVVGEIALKHNMPLYIVHLSSKKGLEVVRSLRALGAKLVVETTPHYLFLDRSKLEGEKGPLYVMTPPLRDREDNASLQEALINGEIQVVATDHCSFTYEQKLTSNDVRTIYPGIPGTEELFILLYNFAKKHDLQLEKVVSLVTENPAKYFGLYPQKGTLSVGSDADLVIFDPSIKWTIKNDNIHSAAKYSPYEGFEVEGRVVCTIARGEVLVEGENYYGKPGSGQFLEAQRSYAY